MAISGQSDAIRSASSRSDAANSGRWHRLVAEGWPSQRLILSAAAVLLLAIVASVLVLARPSPFAGIATPGGWFVPAGWNLQQALMAYSAATLFAGFIPILAGISVYVRSSKANTRLDAAVEIYGLKEDRYYKIYIRNKPSLLWQQALFPIAVTFLIALYFSFIIIFTEQAIGPVSKEGTPSLSTLILMGGEWGLNGAGADRYRIESYLAISFAFLGWYVWSIGTIFSRLATLELVAGTYYNMLIRLVMAVVLALVVRHLAPTIFPAGFVPAAIAIGFGIGIFPDAALTWLSKKLRQSLLAEADAHNDLSLDLIQGVSPFRKLRLYELGMDNCQNLAAANPILLFVTSNLSLLEVLDWMSQAQLAVIFGEKNFATLQANGLRHAQDFGRVCESPAKPLVAKLIDYDPVQLDDLANGLRNDPLFKRLVNLHERVRKADEASEPQVSVPPPPPGKADTPNESVPWLGRISGDLPLGSSERPEGPGEPAG